MEFLWARDLHKKNLYTESYLKKGGNLRSSESENSPEESGYNGKIHIY
jgi:hypothetical protein